MRGSPLMPCSKEDWCGYECGSPGVPVVAEGEDITTGTVHYLCPACIQTAEDRGFYVHRLTWEEFQTYLERSTE